MNEIDNRRMIWKRFIDGGFAYYRRDIAGDEFAQQKDFAKWLRVDPSNISRWKKMDIDPPDGEILDRVAARLGIEAYIAAGQPICVPNDSPLLAMVESLYEMRPEIRKKAMDSIDKLAKLPVEMQGPFTEWILSEANRAEAEQAEKEIEVRQQNSFSFSQI